MSINKGTPRAAENGAGSSGRTGAPDPCLVWISDGIPLTVSKGNSVFAKIGQRSALERGAASSQRKDGRPGLLQAQMIGPFRSRMVVARLPPENGAWTGDKASSLVHAPRIDLQPHSERHKPSPFFPVDRSALARVDASPSLDGGVKIWLSAEARALSIHPMLCGRFLHSRIGD